jgi:hypothetical protein
VVMNHYRAGPITAGFSNKTSDRRTEAARATFRTIGRHQKR